MKKFLIPLGAFGLLAIVLAIGVKRSPEKSVIPSALIGKPAPDFQVPELGVPTMTFDSRSMRGQWYLLNVWGTWCVECRAEHEELLAVRRSGRVPLIGLNWKDDDAAAQQWLAQLGNPYERVPVDRDGRIAIDWGVYGAPETFLVDPSGIVVYKHVGALTDQVWREKFLSRLPPAAAAAPPEPRS